MTECPTDDPQPVSPLRPTSLPLSRGDLLLSGMVLLTALGLRGLYLMQAQDNPLFAHPTLDAQLHMQWAEALMNGEEFLPGPYFRAPLYPWALAQLFKVTGVSVWAPRIAQCFLGSLSCILIFLIGRDTFGRTVGTLAGMFAATYWTMIYFDGEILLESLSVMLNMLAAWLLLRAAAGRGITLWIAAGIVFGLSAINRPNVLLFFPAVPLWILFVQGWTRRPAWTRAVVFSLACMVPILPLTVRNYVVGKDLVLISSQAGVNFYIGNNPEADGKTVRLPGARMDWWGMYYDSTAAAELATGRTLRPSEVSSFFFKQGLRFIRANPGQALGIFGRKIQMFWNDVEIPNVSNIYVVTERYAPFLRWLPLRFGIIGALGLMGIFLSRKSLPRHAPLALFVLAYFVSVILFFVNARFRLPVVPFLIIYSAVTVHALACFLRQKNVRALAASTLAIAVLLLLTREHTVGEAYRFGPGARCTIANDLMQAGDARAALAELDDVLAFHADYAVAHNLAGQALVLLGRDDEAIKRFRRAIELDPLTGAHAPLCLTLIRRSQHFAALKVLREGILYAPGDVDLKVILARMMACSPSDYVRNGAEAIRVGEELRKELGDSVATLDGLAAAYAEDGRMAQAVAMAERALEMARESGDPVLVRTIEDHVGLYRAGRRLREAQPLRLPR